MWHEPKYPTNARRVTLFLKGWQDQVSCLVFFIPPSNILNGALIRSPWWSVNKFDSDLLQAPFLETHTNHEWCIIANELPHQDSLTDNTIPCSRQTYTEGCLNAVLCVPTPSWEIQPLQWINTGSLYELELVFSLLIVIWKFPQSSKCTWTFQTGTPYTSGRVNWIRW